MCSAGEKSSFPKHIHTPDENSVLFTRLLVNFLHQNPVKCVYPQKQGGYLSRGAGAPVLLPLSGSHKWIKVLQLHVRA